MTISIQYQPSCFIASSLWLKHGKVDGIAEWREISADDADAELYIINIPKGE